MPNGSNLPGILTLIHIFETAGKRQKLIASQYRPRLNHSRHPFGRPIETHLVFPECVECRGVRGMCGIDPCPLLAEVRSRLPTFQPRRVDELNGPSPPSVFVGRYNYPKITAGPLAIVAGNEESESLPAPADPADLYGQPLETVAARGVNLVRGRQAVGVTDARSPGRILQTTQELAMAERDVDIEMSFRNPIHLGGQPTFDSLTRPLGPTGEVIRAEVTSNAVIPRKVDSVVDETHLLATDAVEELNQTGVGEAHLTRLLSAGLLGHQQRRRLVPTRWAITATDDMLGKRLFEQVRDLPSLGAVEWRTAEYLDNTFHIILTPGAWAFHMLECWHKGSLWASEMRVIGDWEEEKPRTDYAARVTGAYYAARLAVFEHLLARGRSGSCLIWRDIGPGYWAPVGVWLIREAMRDAMSNPGRQFDSLGGAVEFVAERISNPKVLRDSWFLKRTRQSRLSEYSESTATQS